MLAIIGPVIVAFSVAGAAVHGDAVALATRNVEPARLEVVDLAAGTSTTSTPLPAGDGAWGVAVASDGFWAGTFGAAGEENVVRVADGAVTATRSVDSTYVWDLDVEGSDDGDGSDGVVGVRGTPGGAFTLPAGDRPLVDTPLIAPGELGRATTVVGDRTVAGGAIGDRAILVVEELEGEGRRSILPSARAADEIVYDAEPGGGDGQVVVGTIGQDRGDPAVAVIDLDDPEAAQVVRLPGEDVVDQVLADGGRVWATARPSGALWRVDPVAGSAERVAVPRRGSETRSLDLRAGQVLGTSAEGTVWQVDPSTGEVALRTPDELGLEADAQLAQSLAVGGGAIWGGGNFAVMGTDRTTLERRTSFVPGEPKDIVVAGGTAYLAIYPVAEVWAVDGPLGQPDRVAELPDDQRRPQSIAARAAGRLAVTTTDDFGGGAVHVVDPATGAVTSAVDPLGPVLIPTGLAVHDGSLVVGTTSTPAALASLDPDTREVEWVIDDAAPAGGAMVGVAATADRVVGTPSRGEVVVVDPVAQAVVARGEVDGVLGRVRASGDGVLAATYDEVLRIELATAATTPVATDLGSEVFGYPHLAVDEDGTAYAVKGRNLIEVPYRSEDV